MVYARLLGEKIRKHNSRCWLVNTGWTGGAYGIGTRMKISYTRAMVDALLSGMLNEVEYDIDPIFGLQIPRSCSNVPAEVLNPRNTWPDPAKYDAQARNLAAMFIANFEKYREAAPCRSTSCGTRGLSVIGLIFQITNFTKDNI